MRQVWKDSDVGESFSVSKGIVAMLLLFLRVPTTAGKVRGNRDF